MNSKNAYAQLCADIREKVTSQNRSKGKSSSAVSKSDLENMAYTLLNTPEHTVDVYQYASKDTSGTGGPISTEKRPSKRHRDALKLVARQLGVDKADADKIDDMVLPKEYAASMMDVAGTVLKDYMDAGRKYAFPITSDHETRMEISITEAPERISSGNRFNKDAGDDTITVTHERNVMKTKNPVPYWLKETRTK